MVQRGFVFGVVASVVVGGCFDPLQDVEGDDIQDETSTSGGEGTDEPDTTGGEIDDASSSGEPSTEGSTTGAVFAQVRAVHAAPDVGPVDIYVAGESTPLFAGLGYGETTQRVEVLAGGVPLEFRPAGADTSDEPVFATELMLAEGEAVTAVAAGLLESEDENDRFRLLPVVEAWGAPLAGRARARVVHAGADAPSVYLDVPGDDDGAVARFETTPSAGFALDVAGGERLTLLEDAAGDAAPITSFTAPQVAEGDEVLLIATGLTGRLAREPEGFAVLAVGRDGSLGTIRQDPELFIVHGSRDAGPLETCTGDVELAANFEYGDIRAARVAPGTYDVGVFDYPSGCGNEPFSVNTTGALEAGERYLLLVTGEVMPEDAGEASIQVATFADEFPLGDEDSARLRFVHGASYSQIYVGNVVQDQIVETNVYTSPIAWSVESVEVDLMEGFYLLGIADAVDKPAPPYAPIVTLPFEAVGGARQWAIIAGDPSPEEGDGFLQAMVVDTSTPRWSVTLADVQLP